MLTFFIDKESRLIIEKYTGIIRISTVRKLIDKVWEHAHYDRNYDRIIDFRNCELVFSLEELRNFIKMTSESPNAMRGKAAVLVQEPISAAIVTMYEDQMKHFHKVGIFCSESEVMNFLDVDNSIFDHTQSAEAITVSVKE